LHNPHSCAYSYHPPPPPLPPPPKPPPPQKKKTPHPPPPFPPPPSPPPPLCQFLLSGTFVDPDALDLPKWAAWLAESGYDNKAGWNTLLAAIKVRVCVCGGVFLRGEEGGTAMSVSLLVC